MRATKKKFQRASTQNWVPTTHAASRPMELFLRFGQFCQHTEVLERSRVACNLRAAGDFFQQSAHNFATAGFWKRFGKTDFVWFCNRPDVHANMLAQFRFQSAGDANARFQRHKSNDALSF